MRVQLRSNCCSNVQLPLQLTSNRRSNCRSNQGPTAGPIHAPIKVQFTLQLRSNSGPIHGAVAGPGPSGTSLAVQQSRQPVPSTSTNRRGALCRRCRRRRITQKTSLNAPRFPPPSSLPLSLCARSLPFSLCARALSSTCARGAARAHAAMSTLAQAESKKYMRTLLEVTRGLEES